jgi:predicted RNA-binding protein with PUA-like domain
MKRTAASLLPTQFWLMKTEPDVFSLQDLLGRKNPVEKWDGVRNYQARNFMMHHMKVGHQILFYHSNGSPSGVAGIARVVAEASPDKTAWDPKSEYFDPKSTPQNPIWFCVTVGSPVLFPKFVSLEEMRSCASLADLLVLQKGQRLSILPVTQAEFTTVCELGGLSFATMNK